MKFLKITALFLTIFLIISFTSPISAQVNIIEDYDGDTLENINSSLGSNAWVVATGDPENQTFINVVNSYNFNWVIRGHAAWQNIGQQMISDPEGAAGRWLNFFGQIDKTVYFEPWNEPEHPEECLGLSNSQCADRIIRFLDTFTANMPSNAILMTPAFDTVHSNHIAFIEELNSRGFFSRYNFRAVSYHIYGTGNITSYRQFSWANGLPIVITESGAIGSNGLPTYLPINSLCEFYEQAVPVWQADSRVRGWSVLIIDPHNPAGGWNLFDPGAQCVVDALQGNFHCQDCGTVTSGTSGSVLSGALKCPPIELRDGFTCGSPNQTTDCFWAPNLQQACNEIQQPEDAPYCAYNVYPDVSVNNNMTNCDGESCTVAGGENHTADMGESGDWDDNGVPTFLASLVFALIGRPESDLPWAQSRTNLLNAGYDRKSAPYQVTLAEKDKVMIQAAMAQGGLESNGSDFIIGCAFASNETVDAVAFTPRSGEGADQNGNYGCSANDRPVYVSELACMNETRTYKVLAQGLRIENVPFPEEVNEICDNYYGADRFELGAISPTSGYAQDHNVSGQVMGILPHHASNMLWRMLFQNVPGSLEFETRIMANQEQSTTGTLAYGGGFLNAAGYTSDGISQSDFAAINMLLPQSQLGEIEETNNDSTNFCAEATSVNYQSTSNVRINSIMEFLVSLVGRVFNFGSSTDEEGAVAYETRTKVQESVRVEIAYPGLIESSEKIKGVYKNFLPEAEVQKISSENNEAIILRSGNTSDDKAQRLPAVKTTAEFADAFYKWSWPQSWQEGRF